MAAMPTRWAIMIAEWRRGTEEIESSIGSVGDVVNLAEPRWREVVVLFVSVGESAGDEAPGPRAGSDPRFKLRQSSTANSQAGPT